MVSKRASDHPDQNLNSKDAPFNYFAGEYDEDVLVEAGDLLFSWSGTVGSSFGSHLWTGETGVLNQHIFKIGLCETITKRYAFHGLRYITEEIEQSVNGAVGLVHITKEKLNEFTLLVPPLAEQQRIVGILDEAFNGIATAKANAERNLQNAHALFESSLDSVFSNGGPDWRDKLLAEVVDPTCTLSYGIVQPGNECSHGLPIVRPTDLTAKVIYVDGLKRIDADLARGYKRTTLCGGDLLLCVRGSTGVIAVAADELAGANVTRGIVPIRFNQNYINPEFGFHLMRSSAVQNQIRSRTYGAALMQINIRDVSRRIALPFPPLKEQGLIARKLNKLSTDTERLIDLYEQKLNSLEALKKSLLHQAFTGGL